MTWADAGATAPAPPDLDPVVFELLEDYLVEERLRAADLDTVHAGLAEAGLL